MHSYVSWKLIIIARIYSAFLRFAHIELLIMRLGRGSDSGSD